MPCGADNGPGKVVMLLDVSKVTWKHELFNKIVMVLVAKERQWLAALADEQCARDLWVL